MSEQQRIYGVLQKMIGGASKKDLEELEPSKYKNPYVDDGSFEFEQLQMEVIRAIAEKLFKANDVEAVKAVPAATIKKVMKALKDSAQDDIDYEFEQAKLAMKLEGIEKKQQNKREMLERVSKLEAVQDKKGLRRQYLKYENPEREATYAKFVNETAAALVKDKSNASQRLAIKFGEGLDMDGGRRKRRVNISPAERKRRSDRMKKMWADKRK